MPLRINMIKISQLIPTHNSLRNLKSFYHFVAAFYQHDGDTYGWSIRRGSKISIIQTEDDKLYLWDGHHCAAAAHWAGHAYIPRSEYNITKMTYEKVMTINFDKGYVTPFDMRTECRLADFSFFKNFVLDIYRNTPNPLLGIQHNYEEIKESIKEMSHQYKELRKAHNIEELINASGLS